MRAKLLICKLLCFFALLIPTISFAQINYNLKSQYRSTPSALNILGTFSYDKLLWGNVDKQKPLYGYYKLGTVLGGSPTAGIFVELAPLAPLVFKYQRSATYRFTKSAVFDCAEVYCFGVLQRNDLSMTLVGGYENFVGVSSYLWRDINAPSSSNLVVSEQELFTTTPGNHFYNEFTLTLGYLLLEERVLGVFYTAADFSDGNRRSNSVYGIYHWKWNQLDLTIGAGRYETDQPYVSGNGILFVIGKTFGESLSLF